MIQPRFRTVTRAGTELRVATLGDCYTTGGAWETPDTIQSLFDLALGQGNVLHKTENINELEAKKLNIFILDDLHNFFPSHLLFYFLFMYFKIASLFPTTNALLPSHSSYFHLKYVSSIQSGIRSNKVSVHKHHHLLSFHI